MTKKDFVSRSATSFLAIPFLTIAFANRVHSVESPTAATPVFSLKAGTYTSAQTLSISDATSGATIYYTTNGVAPTTASSKYTAAIMVSTTETIEAIAVAQGDANSAVASAAYTIETSTATPSFTPVTGTYPGAQIVSIKDTTSGAAIYYTTNGTTPTTASTKYTAPIDVSKSETLKAIAIATGHTASTVATAVFTIETPTPAPTFSPVAGTYDAAQQVSLKDAASSATIYYTTNGSAPTTSSTKYTAPINVGGSETLKAIAVAPGDTTSTVSSATYTITPMTYTIGGTVIGLKKPGTVHVLNSTDNEAVSTNGTFILPTAVKSGTAYKVSVGTTPTGQVCAVQNGSGTVAKANVTNVVVYCTYSQSVATLKGSYDGAGYNINLDTDGLAIGVPFDGAGNEGNTATGIVNVGGTVITVTNDSSSAGPYTVVTTNAIPVLTTGGNNIGAVAGADSDEFLWIADASTTDGGGLPALAVHVRPLENATLASLAGNWIAVGLDQGSDPQDFEGVLTFGADGSVSGTSTSLDVNGVVSVFPYSAPAGTCTITSGGQFTSGGGTLGYVSANGEFVVETYTRNGTSPGLTLVVKRGTGVTLATVNGVYTLGDLGFNSAAGTTGDGRVYTLFFDGAGHFSGTFIDNANGTITDGNTVSGTYAVTSTGELTLLQSNGAERTGGVSADGNIMVAANLTAGGLPRIFVGFRQ